MRKYRNESERARLVACGRTREEAVAQLRQSMRHPTVKRLSSVAPFDGDRWIGEVGSALSEFIGTCNAEGWEISDVSNGYTDEILTSFTFYFDNGNPDDYLILGVRGPILQPDRISSHSMHWLEIEVKKAFDGMHASNQTRIGWRSTIDREYDLYDLATDNLIPGIARLARFVAGTCEYLG